MTLSASVITASLSRSCALSHCDRYPCLARHARPAACVTWCHTVPAGSATCMCRQRPTMPRMELTGRQRRGHRSRRGNRRGARARVPRPGRRRSWPTSPEPDGGRSIARASDGDHGRRRHRGRATGTWSTAQQALGPIDLFFGNAGVGNGRDPMSPGGRLGSGVQRQRARPSLGCEVPVARVARPRRGLLLLHRVCCRTAQPDRSGPYSLTKHAAVAFAEWMASPTATPG